MTRSRGRRQLAGTLSLSSHPRHVWRDVYWPFIGPLCTPRVAYGTRKPCAASSSSTFQPHSWAYELLTPRVDTCAAAMQRVLEMWLQPDLAVAAAAPAVPGGLASNRLPDPVSDSLGLFLILIIVELVVSWQRQRTDGKQQYNLRQSISNLSAGILAVLLGMWVGAPYQGCISKLRISVQQTWCSQCSTDSLAVRKGAPASRCAVCRETPAPHSSRLSLSWPT